MGTLDVAGQYLGGLFWDGRATGAELGNVAAEQARGPFLADKEHNFNTVTGRRDLLVMIRQGSYYPLYKTVYGAGLDNISLTTDPASQLVTDHYNNVAFAIAAYEASSDVNQFSSKYDDVMARRATFTAEEEQGYRLMRSSATKNCGNSGCHAEKGETGPALFTDFTYDNIGLPWKSEYRREESLQKGAVDQGIYTTLVSPNVPRDLPVQNPEAHIAAFKTPTLRNVALGENAGSGGPGRGKRFMHNGIFSSLEEVMHFYNTRDVVGAGWSPSAKADVKTNSDWRPWGAPEYAQTMHRGPEIGNLGLTVRQEKAIVAFMRTLSDTRPVTPPPAYRATATQQITN
jgi:cytochrome c peroxidase